MFSALFLLVFKSWTITVVSFFSGVLLDCDHIVDYFWEYRKRFIVKEFFDARYYGKAPFFMAIFHSWELLVLLSICAFSMNWNPWVVGITIGFAQHIILDQIFNEDINSLKFFFFWRLKNGFNAKEIFQI
jgi:hypothetical protein